MKEVFNDTPFEDNSLVYNLSTKPVRNNNSDLQVNYRNRTRGSEL